MSALNSARGSCKHCVYIAAVHILQCDCNFHLGAARHVLQGVEQGVQRAVTQFFSDSLWKGGRGSQPCVEYVLKIVGHAAYTYVQK